MRYEDWDVLLFPADEESKVPVKEFKVACHVVHDVEFSHINQSPGIPTICCFVPSLAAGTPFQVSMHSWNPPNVSQFTKSCTSFLESVMFQARLFVDGRLMASTAFDRKSSWPHVLAHSFEFSKSGDLQPLKFPYFRQELLQQDHWSPADDLGRIKIVISEGFPRDSFTMPVERVRNVVAFSFQHAPLDILESSGIAWPNRSMWQRVPFRASKPVPSLAASNSDSHAHSPRRRPRQDSSSAYTMPIFEHINAADASKSSPFNPQDPSGGDGHGINADLTANNLSGVDTYFDWLGHMDTRHVNAQGCNSTQPAAARQYRMSSTDTSMPDYVSLGGHQSHKSGNIFGSFPIHEDDDASMGSIGTLQAPMNTPTSGQSMSFGSANRMFPLVANNGFVPSDLAETLTTSLLNQPPPASGSYSVAGYPPATEIKSRKENQGQGQGIILPSVRTGSSSRLEHHATRRASQQTRVLTKTSLPPATVRAASESPQPLDSTKGLETIDRNASINRLAASLTGDSTTDSTLRAVSGNSDKGNKRHRNFTPVSLKAMDETDEPSRMSSRIYLSPSKETEDGNLG